MPDQSEAKSSLFPCASCPNPIGCGKAGGCKKPTLFDAIRQRFRDPRGWLIDALPWRVRKLYVAWRFHEKPSDVPDSVRIISFRKPPQYVFDYFRRLEGLDERQD